MDVLHPNLYITRGFRFRVNPGADSQSGGSSALVEPRPSYSEDYLDTCEPAVEGDGDTDLEKYEIEVTQPYAGKYEAKVAVPSVLFGAVIGKGGLTRMRIEKETQAKIRVPKMGAEGDIVITATEKSHVLAAARRIFSIVEIQRHKLKFTHFVSLPLNKEPLSSKFEEFKRAVRQCTREVDIDERLFGKPEKLHMTMNLMTLLDQREREFAIDMFNKCFEQKIKPMLEGMKELPVHIKGLEIMNDDYAATQVLYAVVQPVKHEKTGGNIVQEIADAFVHFYDKSSIAPQMRSDNVKLHVTLMNAKTLSSDDESDGESMTSAWKARPKGSFKSFDASLIFENLKDFDFGTTLLTEIHLSQRHTTASDGYYVSSHVIKLFE